MKTNGATWKAYLASWPEGQWFDDSDETFDGLEPMDDDPADDAVVEFTCGTVFSDRKVQDGEDLVRHFKKWRKSLTVEFVMCEVPKERLAELPALLKKIGAKVKPAEPTLPAQGDASHD